MFLVTRFNAFSNFMIMLFCIIMCHLYGRGYEPLWVWTFLSAIDIYVSIVTWRVESTDISRRYNSVCQRITASLIRIIIDNKLNLFFWLYNEYLLYDFFLCTFPGTASSIQPVRSVLHVRRVTFCIHIVAIWYAQNCLCPYNFLNTMACVSMVHGVSNRFLSTLLVFEW